MPNWNYNNMEVVGEPKLVKRFIQENFLTQKGSDNKDIYILDFEAMRPTPVDETGAIINDWYDWRLRNWGCKWSPTEDQSITIGFIDDGKFRHIEYDKFSEQFVKDIDDNTEKEMELYVNFFTPWGPPEAMFELWSTTYKEDGLKMSIHFYEPSVGFAGEMKFVKGEEDKYHIVEWCQDNETEYIKYIIENDMEPLEYYIDECYYWISEMHQSEGEEMIEKIFLAVEKQLVEADVDNAVKLILDIKEKYDEFCNK